MPSSNPEVNSWIEQYRSEVQSWPDIADWVRAVVVDAITEDTTVNGARFRMHTVSKFTDWAVRSDLDLDRERLFHPDTVERFIAEITGQVAIGSARSYRTCLRSVGRAVTRKAPWKPAPERIPRSPIAVPYTPREIAQLRADVDNQPLESAWRIGSVLLDLGLGAGLTAHELSTCTAEWVTTRHDVWGIAVPATAENEGRFVPLRRAFVNPVRSHAERWPEGPLVAPTVRRPNRLAERIRLAPSTPPLTTGRLRVTWLVAVLDTPVRFRALLDAAGRDAIRTAELSKHLDHVTTEADLRALAGEDQ